MYKINFLNILNYVMPILIGMNIIWYGIILFNQKHKNIPWFKDHDTGDIQWNTIINNSHIILKCFYIYFIFYF